MIPYYERFMERFPTVKALADASLDEVMELWAGLGYYRRAKYLHESAQMIEEVHGGVFPRTLKDIESLKGVGRYTARAIHAIAYGEPSPAVDGNVMRVMARILGYEKDIRKTAHMREIETILKPVIVHEDPSDFTEALMEIGALVCKKANPLCESCPLKDHCFAYKQNRQADLPVVSKRAKKQSLTYVTFIIRHDGSLYLEKRPEGGLLGGLYGFIQYEGIDLDEALKTLKQDYGFNPDNTTKLGTFKHVFTHKVWHMHAYLIDIDTPPSESMFEIDALPAISNAHLKLIESLEK